MRRGGDGQMALDLPRVRFAPPTVYCLTLWDPWLWCMVDLAGTPAAKDVENRPWAPPRWVLGRWVGLHAGLRWDLNAPARCREALRKLGMESAFPEDALALRDQVDARRGHVVAVARFDEVLEPYDPAQPEMALIRRVVAGADHRERAGAPRAWHFPDEYGWTVGGIHRLAHPVRARGFQKLWRLRGPDRTEVLDQLPAGIVAELAGRS